MDDYYDLLGISPQAGIEEIQRAFRSKQEELHPDRVRVQQQQQQQQLNMSSTGSSVSLNSKDGDMRPPPTQRNTHMLSKINEAYKVLIDEAARYHYDITQAYIPKNAANLRKLKQLRIRRAERDVSNMQQQYETIKAREEAERGIVVIDARYGDQQYLMNFHSTMHQAGKEGRLSKPEPKGPFHDVTIPIQCLVHDGCLLISGGRPKYELPGVAQPLHAGEVCALYIFYKFGDRYMHVIANELEMVAEPVEAHVLPYEDKANLQFIFNKGAPTITQERQRKRRNQLTLLTVLIALATATAYKKGWLNKTTIDADGNLQSESIAAYWLRRFWASSTVTAIINRIDCKGVRSSMALFRTPSSLIDSRQAISR